MVSTCRSAPLSVPGCGVNSFQFKQNITDNFRNHIWSFPWQMKLDMFPLCDCWTMEPNLISYQIGWSPYLVIIKYLLPILIDKYLITYHLIGSFQMYKLNSITPVFLCLVIRYAIIANCNWQSQLVCSS